MAILFNKYLMVLFSMLVFSYSGESNAPTESHPYHVSATEIEYEPKERRLEISSRLFTDDFESVLTKLYKTKTDFTDKSLKKQMDELVHRYISTHLAIRSNGKLLPLQLYGWEQDREAIIIYTTAPAINFDTKNITIENTILYDLFNDQLNIVHIIIGKERQSNKISYPDRKTQFSF